MVNDNYIADDFEAAKPPPKTKKELLAIEIARLAELSPAEAEIEFGDVMKQFDITKAALRTSVNDKRKLVKAAKKKAEHDKMRSQIQFEIGSHIEFAKDLVKLLRQKFADLVYDEGKFWWFKNTEWVEIDHDDMHKLVADRYDGVRYGNDSTLRLTPKAIDDSILVEVALRLKVSRFFAAAQRGINCLSGFIVFDEKDGTPTLLPHSPEHRARQTVPAHWFPTTDAVDLTGSLLDRFLHTLFRHVAHGEQYCWLLQEIVGAVISDHATALKQPKCFVFAGQGANNGKSTLIRFIRSFVPASAVTSVPPRKFDDEKYLVNLIGKLLNTSDELSASALMSDMFKMLVDGINEVAARSLYKDMVTFRPRALHIFATQKPPSFIGGIDQGVQRRVIIVDFPKPIPKDDRVLNIVENILDTEQDLTLAWAVEGASRLIRQHDYTLPDNVADKTNAWVEQNDSVHDWLARRVRPYDPAIHGPDAPSFTRFYLFQHYRHWCDIWMTSKPVEKAEFYRRCADVYPDIDWAGGRTNATRQNITGIVVFGDDCYGDDDIANEARLQNAGDPIDGSPSVSITWKQETRDPWSELLSPMTEKAE